MGFLLGFSEDTTSVKYGQFNESVDESVDESADEKVTDAVSATNYEALTKTVRIKKSTFVYLCRFQPIHSVLGMACRSRSRSVYPSASLCINVV